STDSGTPSSLSRSSTPFAGLLQRATTSSVLGSSIGERSTRGGGGSAATDATGGGAAGSFAGGVAAHAGTSSERAISARREQVRIRPGYRYGDGPACHAALALRQPVAVTRSPGRRPLAPIALHLVLRVPHATPRRAVRRVNHASATPTPSVAAAKNHSARSAAQKSAIEPTAPTIGIAGPPGMRHARRPEGGPSFLRRTGTARQAARYWMTTVTL